MSVVRLQDQGQLDRVTKAGPESWTGEKDDLDIAKLSFVICLRDNDILQIKDPWCLNGDSPLRSLL